MCQVKKILILLLCFIPILAFSGSATKQDVDTAKTDIDKSISHMNKKEEQAKEDLAKKEGQLGQTALNGMLIANGKQPGLLNTATITTVDKNGNPIIMTLKCLNINGTKQCLYVKQQSPSLNISYSNPPNISIPVKPNNVGQVSNPWVSVIATLMYLSLTVYLFVVASSNLFKREILYLIIDLSLWVMLTASMYYIWTSYLL